MALQSLLDALDAEITRMQTARALLAGSGDFSPATAPAATSSKKIARSADENSPRQRTTSAEGRARIAEGQKRRWASRHAEVTANSATAKKASGKVVGKKALLAAKSERNSAQKQSGSVRQSSAAAKGSAPAKASMVRLTPKKSSIKRSAKKIAGPAT